MKRIIVIAILLLICLFSANNSFATGVWDQSTVLVGVNPNADWQTGDTVSVKKAALGPSGCTVVKFRPGYGNMPLADNGIAARNRIFATALAAYLSATPVSIWVYDTANCYGLMLEFTDSAPF